MKKAEKLARAEKARLALRALGGSDASTDNAPQGERVAAPAATGAPTADQARKSGKSKPESSSGVVYTGARGEAPPPSDPVPPEVLARVRTIKAWEGPPPQEGDIVFYRGNRYWVEAAPAAFSPETSPWVRIGDKPVPKPIIEPTTGLRVHRPLNNDRESFYVHPDLLKPLPPDFNRKATRLPTVASVARAERAKSGSRDVGDEIATRLRECGDLESVYRCAAEYLREPVEALKKKYAHLNPGQQRMNLGNRMRAKWKKEHV